MHQCISVLLTSLALNACRISQVSDLLGIVPTSEEHVGNLNMSKTCQLTPDGKSESVIHNIHTYIFIYIYMHRCIISISIYIPMRMYILYIFMHVHVQATVPYTHISPRQKYKGRGSIWPFLVVKSVIWGRISVGAMPT